MVEVKLPDGKKDINDLDLEIEKYLIDAGMNVVLTRNSDAGLYGVASKNLKRKDIPLKQCLML